jgi:hypothetical protein
LRYALLFPIVMSFAYGVFFVYGAILNEVTRRDVFPIRDALGFQVAPELRVLSVLLVVSAVMFFVVAVGLIVVFCAGDRVLPTSVTHR